MSAPRAGHSGARTGPPPGRAKPRYRRHIRATPGATPGARPAPGPAIARPGRGICVDFPQEGIKKLYHAGMGKILSVQAGAAAALLALGGAAMLGWILREPALIRLGPTFPGLVFNAGLAFAMLGGALALPLLRWRHAPPSIAKASPALNTTPSIAKASPALNTRPGKVGP
ncbi:MAG: hypothetical protein H7Z39_14585, partial [Burkholderiaceae bacterium]|nr:hypothetical protein [Burkholderiaceae bacterium]